MCIVARTSNIGVFCSHSLIQSSSWVVVWIKIQTSKGGANELCCTIGVCVVPPFTAVFQTLSCSDLHTPLNVPAAAAAGRLQLKDNTAEMFGIELAAEYEYKFSSAKVNEPCIITVHRVEFSRYVCTIRTSRSRIVSITTACAVYSAIGCVQ